MTPSTGLRPAARSATDVNALFDDDLPHLLVHTRADRLDLVAPVCASENLGAVVCVSPSSANHVLTDIAKRYVASGAVPSALMLDADRYRGKKRAYGATEMSSTWVRMQTNLGIAHPLTNSGYIPAGDIKALRAVLRATEKMGRHVVAALPVANEFLTRDLGDLIDEVNAAGVAIGLMVEHRDDPFGARKNVSGLIELLERVEVPVLLLRCDLSIVGALAWGARSGAFGTSTSLRHIYPIGKGGGGGHIPSISAIVKDTLSLTRLDKIDDAIHRLPDPMWSCPCTTCYGRSLDWMATEDQAFQHSLAIVSVLVDRVLDDNLTASRRRELWRGMCQTAQFRALELDSETGGAWGDAPKFLGAWVAQVIEGTTV